jgi:hypothetical protein
MASRFSAGQQFPEEFAMRTLAAADRALEPAKQAGLIRPGVSGGDLMAMLKMLGPAVRPVPNLHLAEVAWRRYLELLLSGIRAGQDALPGHAMDLCELARQAGQLSA